MRAWRERQGVALRAVLPPGEGGEESELQVAGELRTRIGADQWRDDDLRPRLQRLSSERGARDLPDSGGGGRVMDKRPCRVAKDRVLETTVPWEGSSEAHWVLVVPDAGGPYAGTSWRKWIFLSCHAGGLGGHRPANKTTALILRCCWWPSVARDVESWVDRCWTCCRLARSKRLAPRGYSSRRRCSFGGT